MGDFENAFRELVKEAVTVKAEDVEDLEDFVKDLLPNEIDVDKVEGLDRAIEDYVNDNIGDAVQKELEDHLADEVVETMENSDKVKAVIRETVKEVLREFVDNLFNIRTATPV